MMIDLQGMLAQRAAEPYIIAMIAQEYRPFRWEENEVAYDSEHNYDMLEKCILSNDKRFTAQIRSIIESFSTYLSVADSAYSYNASFLQAKFARFEEFCRQANMRYQIIQGLNAEGLLERLWKQNELEEISLMDGMWKIEITQKAPAPACHLAKAVWKEKINPESDPKDVLYCLEWAEADRRQCFVVSGRQAMSGFHVDQPLYGDFSQGCDQLIDRLKEVLKSHEEDDSSGKTV